MTKLKMHKSLEIWNVYYPHKNVLICYTLCITKLWRPLQTPKTKIYEQAEAFKCHERDVHKKGCQWLVSQHLFSVKLNIGLLCFCLNLTSKRHILLLGIKKG